jgi:hypothetical protein
LKLSIQLSANTLLIFVSSDKHINLLFTQVLPFVLSSAYPSEHLHLAPVSALSHSAFVVCLHWAAASFVQPVSVTFPKRYDIKQYAEGEVVKKQQIIEVLNEKFIVCNTCYEFLAHTNTTYVAVINHIITKYDKQDQIMRETNQCVSYNRE